MSLMVSISGIRGVMGESLTPEVAVRYAAAFGEYCKRGNRPRPLVVLGRDGRVTGAPLTDIVRSTLLATGVDVQTIGICPTPTVQLAVEKGGAAGGISITASHNPIQWNGLKFIASTGMFLDADENRELWDIAGRTPLYVPWGNMGKETAAPEWIQKHIDDVLHLPYLDPGVVQRRRLRVVLDCVNAAGGVIVPTLLRALGCDVIEMNCAVDGVFAHLPEPLPENLGDLAAQVTANRADLGIAVDPDVDRLVLITELGTPYSEEYTVASAVKFVLGKRPRDLKPSVVINLSTTRAVDDIARSYGAEVQRTPVGEINVAKRMKQIGALVGGEGSGGVILPAVHLGRDAIVGIGLLLQMLAEFGGTLSQLKASMPQYSIVKGRIPVGKHSPDDVLKQMSEIHSLHGRINTDDGLKIDFPESWVHLRKSNTEPIIRIIAEATSAAEARTLVDDFTREITARAG